MISSEKEYLDAMREMIRKVQSGYEPPFDADMEELEIFADCIRSGYLHGTTTGRDADGREYELRTLDGKMHAQLTNHIVTPKGFAFLELPGKDSITDNDQKTHGHLKEKLQSLPIRRIAFIIGGTMTALATLIQIADSPTVARFFAGIADFFRPVR